MVWPVKRTPMMCLDNSTVTSKENPKIGALRGGGAASPPCATPSLWFGLWGKQRGQGGLAKGHASNQRNACYFYLLKLVTFVDFKKSYVKL